MSKFPYQVGPDSYPYLDRLEPDEWQDEPDEEEDEEERAACKRCGEWLPIDELEHTPNGFLCSACE